MNKYKFTYKNTILLNDLIHENGSTKIQPIDFIVANNKSIVKAIYRDTVIHGYHGVFRFKLDTSRISPDNLGGKIVYMNYINVTDGSICARIDRNGKNDLGSNEIIVKIGPSPFATSTYEVCRLTISSVGVSVQNLTNSYNVRAKYNEDTKTLYLTDEAEEA